MENTIEAVAKAQRNIWNIPNALSFFRIGVTPLVVAYLFYSGPVASFLAALFFSLASITDLLDGYIARQWKNETSVGKLLDPLADKLLINSALIMLIPLGRVPAWMVVLIVAREVAITGLRGMASLDGIVIAASAWGKRKTVFQCIALIALLLHYEYLGIDFHLLGMLLLWMALVITLWSGFDYMYKFYREHQKKL